MSLRIELLIEVGPRQSNEGVTPGEPIACWVELGASWVRYREARGREVTLDFESRRRIVRDADAGRVDDSALLATLGFRAAELPNRAYIASVLEAGGAPATGFGPVFVEHQLAVSDPGRRTTIAPGAPVAKGLGATLKGLLSRRVAPDIEVATQGADVTYSHAGELLVAHSTRGTDAAPGHVRAFVQFLRYRFGGHPLVLDRLASLKHLPEVLRLRGLSPMSLDDGAVSIRVTEAREVAGERPPRDGAPAIFDEPQEPIDAILLERASRSLRDDRPAPGARLDDALAVAREGRVFEALLAFFVLSLEQPVSIPPALADAAKASPDPRLAVIVGAPTTEEEARARADALAALRAKVDTHVEALLAFEAATRASLNELERAKELYVEALKLNPWLLGAYKDLGDCYMREYEVARAWRCWEAARRLAPSHGMLRDFDQLEQRLVAEHPEYVRV